MSAKRNSKPRRTVTCVCYHCGDLFDEWADRLTKAQAAYDQPRGVCPGCREARAHERGQVFRASFGQRERVTKPDDMRPAPLMDDEYRDRWARATGRGE